MRTNRLRDEMTSGGGVPGLYQRNGFWYTRYKINGRSIKKSFGNSKVSKKQAIAHLLTIHKIREEGVGHIPETAKEKPLTSHDLKLKRQSSVLKLGQLCDEYLAHIQNLHNPNRPQDQINPPVRIKAIKKAFGHRDATSIAPHEISDWLVSLNRAPATLNRYKSTFSAIYRYAKERKKVDANPVRDTSQFHADLGIPRYLTPEEEKRLYSTLERWIKACTPSQEFRRLVFEMHICELDVAIGTGLRKGNQYELEQAWCDFENRRILIPRTKIGTHHVIPMIDRVYDALREMERIRDRMEELHKLPTFSQDTNRLKIDTRVFPIRENKSWFGKALKESKIQNFRWHDLRHTTASLMAQGGAHLKAIQEAMGHKSIATTTRYAHMNQEILHDAMSVLNRKV